MMQRIKRLDLLEEYLPRLEQLVVQQATVLDAEFGMKKSALPQLVLCARKFNPTLGSYEREELNAGNPMRLYDSLKLLLRQSTFDNILRL
jgi:hypothetical protein